MANRTKRTPRRGGLALASLRRGGQVAEVWRWTRTARPFCCDSSWLKSHFAFPSFWFLPSTCHNPPGCLGVRRIRPPPGRRQTGSGHRQPGPPCTSQTSSFGFLGRKGPRSAAEWSAPWKRSFCSSGPDKNRTLVLCVSGFDCLFPPQGFGEPGAVVSSLALPWQRRASWPSLKKEGGGTSQRLIPSRCRAAVEQAVWPHSGSGTLLPFP